MKLFFVPTFLVFAACGTIQLFAQQFQKEFNGPGDDKFGKGILTSDGKLIISGTTKSFGAGGEDILLFKCDQNANQIWAKSYGVSANENGKAVVEGPDKNFYCTASFNGDFLLLKTDTAGNLIFSKTYGGTGTDQPYGLLAGKGNEIYLFGSYTTGNNTTDAYLIKTDTLGDTLWTTIFGRSDDDYIKNLYFGVDSDLIMLGATKTTGYNNWDLMISKISRNTGDTIWNKVFGSINADIPAWMSIDTVSSEIFIVGVSSNNILIFKMDYSGYILWNRIYDFPNSATFSDAVKTTNGYIITGTKYYSSVFGYEVFAFEVDLAGDTLWTKYWLFSKTDDIVSIFPVQDEYLLFGNKTNYTSPFIFRIDSIGFSGGCNEEFLPIIVDSANLPSLSNTITITHDGIISNPLLSVGSFLFPDSLFCSSADCNLTSQIVRSNVSCFGADDGGATVYTTSGHPPYSFLWSTGDTSTTVDGLVPGTHYVTVTDAYNCVLADTCEITEPGPLSIKSSVCPESLSNNDGSIKLYPQGGTAPFSFNWSNSSLPPQSLVSNLSSGTYFVTVEDINGCQATDQIDLIPVSGYDDYFFQKSFSNTITSFGSGFMCQDQDDNLFLGCYSEFSTILSKTDKYANLIYSKKINLQSNGIVLVDFLIDYNNDYLFCSGRIDSALFLFKTDENYNLQWAKKIQKNDLDDPAKIIQLDDGSYMLTAGTNTYSPYKRHIFLARFTQNGDTIWSKTYGGPDIESPYDIIQIDSLSVLVVGYTKSYLGNNEYGQLLIKIGLDGTYHWGKILKISDISKADLAFRISTGEILISGASGDTCIITKINSSGNIIWSKEYFGYTLYQKSIIELDENEGFLFGGTIQDTMSPFPFFGSLLKTGLDGSLKWCRKFGSEAESFSKLLKSSDNSIWGFGSTTIDSPNNLPGMYLIKTDTFGNSNCYKTDASLLVSPTILQEITFVPTVNVSGCSIEDISGISFSNYYGFNENAICPDTCELFFNQKIAHDCNFPEADISLNIANCQMPYSILWSTGDTLDQLTISNGSYSVTVTASNGCTKTNDYLITDPPPLTLIMASSSDSGNSSGTAKVMVNGGNSPYSYIWSNGDSSFQTINLSSQNYLVTVTDANGCSEIGTVSVFPLSNDPGFFSLEGQIFISPNPNNGKFTIQSTSGFFKADYIEIYNILGEKIYSKSITKFVPLEIDFSGNSSGVYFCSLRFGNTVQFKKLLKN